MTSATLERPIQNCETRIRSAESLRRRTILLLRTEIDFISNPQFLAGARAQTKPNRLSEVLTIGSGTLPKDLPAHLARLCESELLSAEQERELFREMNFLRFRANALRSRLDPESLDENAVDEVERLIDLAESIRDHIIRANMRLAISVVKKFVTPQHSFDDLLSDGIFSLMQAVDKFDFARGFRFSTYAYRAIARNAYRGITTRQKENARFTTEASESVIEIAVDRKESSLDEQSWSNLRALLAKMMHRLDRREQFIIRSRYALGAHRKVRTFQCLADKLGVSKERARQLEQRAIAKLQAMSAETPIDELVGPAVA